MAINTPHQHGSYQAKLFDKRWQMKREIILNRDNRQCVICGKTDNLIVHHKQYHIIFAFLISLELFVVTSKLGDKKCDYDMIIEHQLNVKTQALEELVKV